MKYLTLLIATSFLAGCGGSSSGDSKTTIASASKTSLEGTWLKSCNPVDPKQSDTLYDIIKTSFTGNQISIEIKNYKDSNCSSAATLPLVTASGSFKVGDAVKTSSGVSAKKLDISLTKSSFSSFQRQSYDIFSIRGAVLNMGDNSGANDGSTVAKRPIALDFNRTFNRQ